jgi:hypothetical protein
MVRCKFCKINFEKPTWDALTTHEQTQKHRDKLDKATCSDLEEPERAESYPAAP